MHNLVNKFTPQTDVTTDDDGVVAIEYVLVAGLVALGVAFTFAVGVGSIWAELLTKLKDVV